MMSIKWIYRLLTIGMVYGLLTSCAIPTGGWTNPTSQWAGVSEVTILKNLYDDTNRLLALSNKARVREFRKLQKQTADADSQLSLQNHLRSAALLGGVEPSILNYKQARQELMKARQLATSLPLVSSYIRSQLGWIEQLNKLRRAELRSASKRSKRKNSRQNTAEVVVVEQPSSEQQEALTAQVSALEMQLKQRNSKISELEAKIQALSAIERSLNQRTQ